MLLDSDSGMGSSYIAAKLGIPKAPASHHLVLMAQSGLLLSHKSGRNRFYFPNRDLVSEIADILGEVI